MVLNKNFRENSGLKFGNCVEPCDECKGEEFELMDEEFELMDEAPKPHFELTDETRVIDGVTVYRIKCVETFTTGRGEVKEGELGGFIEKVENLHDDAWVFDDAIVYGNAKLIDKAFISHLAVVHGDACVEDTSSVTDESSVGGEARVWGSSILRGETIINGRATIRNVETDGVIVVTDDAIVRAGYDSTLTLSGYITISDNARVDFGRSGLIVGKYKIERDAYIEKSEDVCSFNNVGSRLDTLTAYRTKNDSVRIVVGCFLGDITEFRKRVQRKDANSIVRKEYELIADTIQLRFIDHDTSEYLTDLKGVECETTPLTRLN